jgi:hypothetical protein
MAGHDGGSQAELGGRRVRVVGMDIDSVIIGAGGEQAPRSGPTVAKSLIVLGAGGYLRHLGSSP